VVFLSKGTKAREIAEKVRYFAKSNGVKIIEEAPMVEWSRNAVQYDEEEFDNGYEQPTTADTAIYSLLVGPESVELLEKRGWAQLQMAMMELKGKTPKPYLSAAYHGVSDYKPLSYRALHNLSELKVPLESNGSGKGCAKTLVLYPVFSTDSELAKLLMEQGKMAVWEIDAGPLKGKKAAQLLLPDELCRTIQDPLFYSYLGKSAATFMQVAVNSDDYDNGEVLKEMFGEKEYPILMKHFGTVCEHAVIFMKVTMDTHGLTLLEWRDLWEEEKEHLTKAFQEYGISTWDRCIQKGVLDISNVLKRNIGYSKLSEEDRMDNAWRIMKMLEQYEPMRDAREKTGVGHFYSGSDLKEIVEDAIEASANRKKKRNEEDDENGNGE
jgi:hypothetical protein